MPSMLFALAATMPATWVPCPLPSAVPLPDPVTKSAPLTT